jgi:hypothetical protein
MLIKSTISLAILLFTFNLNAQSGEISLDYQFGIAGSRFRAENNSKDKFAQGKNGDLTASNWLYDHNLTFSYKHQFIKRWKLLWNFGVEFGVFYRNNTISWNGLIYDVIRYKTFRTEYQIGLIKRFETKTGKISFDLGFDLAYRKYRWDQFTGSAVEYESPYGNFTTVQYVYTTINKSPNILNLELVVKSNFQLTSRMHLNFGTRIAFNYVEYQQYAYQINSYDQNGNLIGFYGIQTMGDPVKRAGNYIYLTAGLSYHFDWKEIFKEKATEK